MEVEIIIEISIVVILSLTGIVFNSMELVSLLKRRTLGNSSLIIASLSMADLVIVVVRPAVYILVKMEYIKNMIVMYSIPLGTAYNSFFHILLMTSHRFLAAKFPLWYRVNMTRKWTKFTCILTWILSLLMTASIFVAGQFMHFMDLASVFSAIFSVLVLATGCVCLICYIYITAITSRRSRTLTHNGSARQISHDSQIKTLKISLAITLTYIVLNFPPTIMYLLNYHQKWHKWLRVLYLLNSTLNSVIYFWLNSNCCNK